MVSIKCVSLIVLIILTNDFLIIEQILVFIAKCDIKIVVFGNLIFL